MLLAGSLAALTTSLRAQSAEDDAGTVTTDTGDATRQGKDEIKEPPGEPKGTNVTGAEESTEATVDPSDAEQKGHQEFCQRGKNLEHRVPKIARSSAGAWPDSTCLRCLIGTWLVRAPRKRAKSSHRGTCTLTPLCRRQFARSPGAPMAKSVGDLAQMPCSNDEPAGREPVG